MDTLVGAVALAMRLMVAVDALREPLVARMQAMVATHHFKSNRHRVLLMPGVALTHRQAGSLRPHFTQSSLAMSTVPLPHSVLGCVTARPPPEPALQISARILSELLRNPSARTTLSWSPSISIPVLVSMRLDYRPCLVVMSDGLPCV